jgi:F1F0 ATPase subunit 2
MTSDILVFAIALLSGLLLGVFFFGGLWWTVRRGLFSAAPALWFSVSVLARTGVAIGGFYVVSHGEWRRLLACLLGFFISRSGVLHLSPALAASSPMFKAPP